MDGDRNNFQLIRTNTTLETIPHSCKPSDLQNLPQTNARENNFALSLAIQIVIYIIS